MIRLDDKLARIRSGAYRRPDFIIADAKDPDMGPGLHAVGPASGEARFKTRAEFLDSIEAIVKQDVVDIMLTSVSNLESLVKRNVFAGTGVKPVIRANDTTDVWRHRGGGYHHAPSRPFRTASLKYVRPLTDLGLYSITFTNDIDADHASLEAFMDFRADAAANGFSYFLEVFNPNVERGLTPETMPQFVNDAIVRCLAGLTEAERPKFLKIAYMGRGPWKSWPRSTPASWSASWAAEPARLAIVSSSFTRRKNMAHASRCSAARSTLRNPRSTSCVSCALSPTAP